MFAPGAAGPNGLQSVAKPIASVGIGTSSVPYGATNGYANPNGVTGFVGPAAGSLQKPTSWYVRVGGSNDNGGSSTSLTAERTGTDGVLSAQSVTFTSASATFTSADVGKGICVGTGNSAKRYRIAAFVNSTTVSLDRKAANNLSIQTWAIGGAWADLRAAIGDAAVTSNTVGVGSAVNAGDTVYVGAGTYRQIYVVPPSAWGDIAGHRYPLFNGQANIVGDVTGAYTGDAGMVQLTAYTTNDKTTPSGSILIDLAGESNIAFSNIVWVGGGSTLLTSTTTSTTSQNISFTDCSFQVGGINQLIADITCRYRVNMNWTFERCLFGPTQNTSGVNVTLTQGSTLGDYDVYITFRQCMFLMAGATNAVNVQATGSGTFLGGGVRIFNCTAFQANRLMLVSSGNSLTFPCLVYGCFVVGSAILQSSNLGGIVEDYNLLYAVTPRSTVTRGANSIATGTDYAPLFHFGQERLWGGLLRPFGEPMAGSPLLGYSIIGGGGPDVAPASDLYGRWRPAGSTTPVAAVGALERGNTAAQGTTPAPTSGTHVWKNTGAWQQDFLLPVAAAADGFSIQVQRDSSYAAGPKGSLPTLEILANPGIGVAYQKITDTGSASAWNTLTAAAFTPTAAGWVTVRITSYDASGASVVAFAVANPS